MAAQIILLRVEYLWDIVAIPAITEERDPDTLTALIEARGREHGFTLIGSQSLGDLEKWACPPDLRDQAERARREFENGLKIGLGLHQTNAEPKPTIRDQTPITRWLDRHPSKPVDLTPDAPRSGNLPEAVFDLCDKDEDLRLFAILDGSEIPCLPELLEMSSVPYLSLHDIEVEDEIGDSALVVAELLPTANFTRDLFLKSDAGWAFGELGTGLYLQSKSSLKNMRDHLVKFFRVEDDTGKIFFHRLGGFQAAWLFLEYLSQAKTDAATFFFPRNTPAIKLCFAWHRGRKFCMRYAPSNDLKPQDRAERFTVSEDYRAFLHRERSKIRAVELIPKLRQSLPGPIQDVDDKALFDRIYFASLGAREIGIREPGNVTKFIFVSVYFRPFFWTDPQTRNRLTNTQGTPDSLFADYYAMLKLYLRRQAGDDLLP